MYEEINKETIHFSKNKINECKGVVLHHTGVFGVKGTISWFANSKAKVSAHILIARNGDRYIFADDNKVCWHAGISEFKNHKYCNNFMLGIEFEGDTNKKPLTNDQIQSFIEWLIPRIRKYKWTIDWITDHRTISPERKIDLEPLQLKRILNAIKYLF